MKTTIIITVGTSLLKNHLTDGFNVLGERRYKKIQLKGIEEESAPAETYETSNSTLAKEIIRNLGNWVNITIDQEGNPYYPSAEIQSTVHYIKENGGDYANFNLRLIATDTVLSRIAAEQIRDMFNYLHPGLCDFVPDYQHDIIKGLVVQNPALHEEFQQPNFFEAGFLNLIERIKQIIDTARGKSSGIILNISGGYKAIIPIVTLLGQIEQVPLIYNYENSSDLVTIGNLPFTFDWAVVEAVKPFLKRNFLENPSIKMVGQLWFNQKLEFKNNKFIGKDEDSKQLITSLKLPYEVNKILNSLINYQLLSWDHLGQFLRPSALGSMIKDFSVMTESNRGFIMEHLLFKYFTLDDRNDLTKDYCIGLTIPKLDKYFILDDNKVQVGDIDVFLNKKDNAKYGVWLESKAFSAAEGYANKIDKKGDYYLQLKARILAMNYAFLETLFVVFRFVFKGINDTEPFVNENLAKVIKHLNKLNQDPEIKDKSRFRCLGVNILAKFDDNKIDVTESFYKGKFEDWTWEEL
ncbi:MAG: hypothetical protein KDC85_06040 [Saprospiraceae bacterium]|nr:hypothetical protein [Saprospiraceae bacterium]